MVSMLLRGICKVLFRVEVNGLKNVPTQVPMLIIANHESLLSGLILGLFFPQKATFVVHTDSLSEHTCRFLLKLFPFLAVNPHQPLALKKLVQLLKSGKNVIIFPEGRLTPQSKLMRVYEGTGFLAAHTGVNILPVRIEESPRLLFGPTIGSRVMHFLPKITLNILPCTQISIEDPSYHAPLTAQQKHRIATESMRSIMQKVILQTQKSRTIYDVFLEAVERFGAQTKIVEDLNGVEETYQDLLKKSLALGRIVTKISTPNEVIGVLMPNVTNTVALVLGMMAFKRIPAMLNYTAGTVGMQNACTLANIKTVVTSRKFIDAANLAEVIKHFQGLKILYLEDLRSHFGVLDRAWLMSYALHHPRAAMESAKADDIAAVLFTSGSEGKPKGVVHTQKSIQTNCTQVLSIFDFNPSDKMMMVLPMFHAFGFTASLLCILNGIKLHIFPSPLQYKVIPEVIHNKGCTIFIATSTFLAQYAKFAHPHEFRKLRYVIAGAEKLNPEVKKIYQEKYGIHILEGYGATECAPVLSANMPTASLEGSVGKFLPGIAHHIEPIPGITTGGELWVKGDNIMKGYYLYDAPGKLVPPLEGWYHTGDVVEVDNQGFIHIKGRVKRFAKVAGEMVSLEVVEKIANTAAPDFLHAATTKPDVQRGENIFLFSTDPNLKRDDLQIVAKNLGFSELSIARKIVYLEEIPLLSTGKTDYLTLKEMAEALTA